MDSINKLLILLVGVTLIAFVIMTCYVANSGNKAIQATIQASVDSSNKTIQNAVESSSKAIQTTVDSSNKAIQVSVDSSNKAIQVSVDSANNTLTNTINKLQKKDNLVTIHPYNQCIKLLIDQVNAEKTKSDFNQIKSVCFELMDNKE